MTPVNNGRMEHSALNPQAMPLGSNAWCGSGSPVRSSEKMENGGLEDDWLVSFWGPFSTSMVLGARGNMEPKNYLNGKYMENHLNQTSILG